MSKKDFMEFLSIKEKEQKDHPKIDWEAKRKKWLSYLDKLYELFEKSLKDYVQKGKIKIAYNEIEISEEYIGNYKAKSMTIEFTGEKIILKPIGTNLIGAKGRVDMFGKSGSAKIVLVDSQMKGVRDHIKKDEKCQEESITWEWRFVTAPPTTGLYQPVNKDTIYSAIMELSNG